MRKLLAASAGLVLALSVATGALAWGNLSVTTRCMPDQTHLAWTIHLPPGENNYKIDWTFASDFFQFRTVDFGSAGDHDFTTLNGGNTIYVRWSSDHDTTAQAVRSTELCVTSNASPTATPESSVAGATGTPEGSVMGATGTPAPEIPDTATPESGGSLPLTAAFMVLLTGSLGGLAYANVAARKRRG